MATSSTATEFGTRSLTINLTDIKKTVRLVVNNSGYGYRSTTYLRGGTIEDLPLGTPTSITWA